MHWDNIWTFGVKREKKRKKWKPSSHHVEGLVITSRAKIEICCLACPIAFVLGNESPLRGGHAGPMPIPLCFNYPACFQQGNEVGVTTGAKWQPVPAALSLGLSFPQRSAANWKGREGSWVKKMRNNRKKEKREGRPTTDQKRAHTESCFHSRPPATVCFHKSQRGEKNCSRRIVFQRPVNKVGIDLIAHVIHFAVLHQVQQ